jgi:hypothetical protein
MHSVGRRLKAATIRTRNDDKINPRPQLAFNQPGVGRRGTTLFYISGHSRFLEDSYAVSGCMTASAEGDERTSVGEVRCKL